MESRSALIRFVIVVAALGVLYLLETNASTVPGLYVSFGEFVAEGVAVCSLFRLQPKSPRQHTWVTRLCLVAFFSMLFVGDVSYLLVYYILKFPPSDPVAILTTRIPYVAAFLAAGLAPLSALHGRWHSLFQPWPLLLSAFAIVPVALRFVVLPLLAKASVLSPLQAVAQGIDITALIALGIIGVLVFVQSQVLCWSSYAAGTIVLVLGDWANQSVTTLGDTPDFGWYEFFWAFGVFLCSASVLSETILLQHPDEPGLADDRMRGSKMVMLTVSFLSVSFVCLSAEGLNIPTIRIITVGAASAVLLAAFTSHSLIYTELRLSPAPQDGLIDILDHGLVRNTSAENGAKGAIPSAAPALFSQRGAVQDKELAERIRTAEEIILLVHGIRTHAEWQEMVAQKLQALPGMLVWPLKEGFFDAPRFWFPYRTREKPIEDIARKIRYAKMLNPSAKISVIAHSFGVYAIGNILKSYPDISFHRLVLCGSVLPQDFRWDQVVGRFTAPVLNECAMNDVWPILAESASWGYGASGTYGFGWPAIIDRFHNVGHSGFFTEKFVDTFWVPWFRDKRLSQATIPFKRPYWWSLLLVFKLKWVSVAVLLYVLLRWYAGILPPSSGLL